MKLEQTYNGMTERQAQIKRLEKQGYIMLSDTFDNPKWVEGLPIKGTMVFVTQDELPIPNVEIDPDKIAYNAASTQAQKIDIIARKLGLV